MIDNNISRPTVEVKTIPVPNMPGWFRTVAHVGGKFYGSISSCDRKENEREIRKALAEGGHVWLKPLAPEMSMKGSFVDVVNKLNPGKGKRTEAFLSQNEPRTCPPNTQHSHV